VPHVWQIGSYEQYLFGCIMEKITKKEVIYPNYYLTDVQLLSGSILVNAF